MLVDGSEASDLRLRPRPSISSERPECMRSKMSVWPEVSATHFGSSPNEPRAVGFLLGSTGAFGPDVEAAVEPSPARFEVCEMRTSAGLLLPDESRRGAGSSLRSLVWVGPVAVAGESETSWAGVEAEAGTDVVDVAKGLL